MKEEEHNEQMTKMMTTVDLLAKNMLGIETKSVNSIREHNSPLLEEETTYTSFDEDVRYLGNQGTGSHSVYHSTKRGP